MCNVKKTKLLLFAEVYTNTHVILNASSYLLDGYVSVFRRKSTENVFLFMNYSSSMFLIVNVFRDTST